MPTPSQTRSEVNHAEPWKEDGNVILVAEETYFRVHRSVLSAYSGVFEDMFDCPHSNECEKESIGNCPVVRLHDAATDIQIILKAMYDRSYPSLCYEMMPISVASAFVRLGEKYDIQALVSEAKAKLCRGFETTSVDAALDDDTPFIEYNLFPEITGGDPNNFQAMNLLQEMDLNTPLALAMYQCLISCPFADIVDGYSVKDSFYALSPATLQTSIRIKDILERYRVALAKNLATESHCSSSKCARNARRLWSKDINVVPPIGDWTGEMGHRFCTYCVTGLILTREAEMDKAWNQIPTAFGCDSWAEEKSSSGFPSCIVRPW